MLGGVYACRPTKGRGVKGWWDMQADLKNVLHARLSVATDVELMRLREILGIDASSDAVVLAEALFDKYLPIKDWVKEKLPLLEREVLSYRNVIECQLDDFGSFADSVQSWARGSWVYSLIWKPQSTLPDYRSEEEILLSLEAALLEKVAELLRKKKKVDVDIQATVMLIMIGRRLRIEKESGL